MKYSNNKSFNIINNNFITEKDILILSLFILAFIYSKNIISFSTKLI